MQHFTRASHGLARKFLGESPRQAGRNAGLRQRFGEQENVRWSRSGHRRDRIHRALILKPFDRAGRREENVRKLALGLVRVQRHRDRDAAADRRRRVGHGANQCACIRQCAGEELQRPPGHDRYDQTGGVDHRRNRRQYLIGDLWLHGDDDRRDPGQCCRIGIDPHAVSGKGGNLRRRLRFDHNGIGRIEAGSQPAVEERAAHLAGADQDEQAGQTTQVRALTSR